MRLRNVHLVRFPPRGSKGTTTIGHPTLGRDGDRVRFSVEYLTLRYSMSKSRTSNISNISNLTFWNILKIGRKKYWVGFGFGSSTFEKNWTHWGWFWAGTQEAYSLYYFRAPGTTFVPFLAKAFAFEEPCTDSRIKSIFILGTYRLYKCCILLRWSRSYIF